MTAATVRAVRPAPTARMLAAGLVLVCGLVGACTSGGSETSATAPPTSSTSGPGLPGGARPTNAITLAMVQPEDGVGAVVRFLERARQSIDIAIYQVDPTYRPLIDALSAARQRGVAVRILLSRTVYPPGSPNTNPQDAAALRREGFEVRLSNPVYSYSHWKLVQIDAGTSNAQALVCDFNLEQSYFGLSPQYPKEGATRGMAALVTDPGDLNAIARAFAADWPPYSQPPASTRPNLLWSPSSTSFVPPGNAQAALTSLISGATSTLDVYAQALAKPSALLQPLLDRLAAGVDVRIVGNKGGINTEALADLTAAGALVVDNPTDPDGDGRRMYIHSKTIVADGRTGSGVAYIGSINPFLDQSLQTERELGVLVTDPASLARIEDTFDRDFQNSRPS